MNEYQDPNWVQAALLFERTVAPCEEYRTDELYNLAKDYQKKEEFGNLINREFNMPYSISYHH